MFLKSLKLVAGSLLVCALIWLLVLGWWQSNDYEPSRKELALYLGALPLAFIGGYLLLHAFIEHLKTPAPSQAQSEAIDDTDPLALRQEQQSAEERLLRTRLLNSFARTRIENIDEIAEAVTSGQRLAPSQQYLNGEGFPLFVGEIESLDSELLSGFWPEEMLAFCEQRPDIQRALAALDPVLLALQAEIVGPLLQTGTASVGLELSWQLPKGWPLNQATLLIDWLKQRYWPDLPANAMKFSWHPVSSEGGSLKLVDDAIIRLGRHPEEKNLIIILAATSMLAPELLTQMESDRQLFNANNPNGQMPGEGAVALVLGTPAAAALLAEEGGLEITRINLAHRDKPIDAPGRIHGNLMARLTEDLLSLAELPAEKIIAGFADTDHRANRSSELFETLSQSFPHWDITHDLLPIATVTGTLSPFGGLLALACAQRKSVAENAPVLCISNQHATERALTLLIPCSGETVV